MNGSPDTDFQARPDLHGSFGMSASTHWLASSSAQSVLERGGNAFDAAVAAAFVLHVVEPHLNGPGGDLVAIVAPAGSEPRVLCGQGPAPSRATIEHFRNEGLKLIPGGGALAAAVPGAVDAWLTLLRDHGTWELDTVLEYAIGYANNGHRILNKAAHVIGTVAELFRDHWPSSAQLWMPTGAPPVGGDIVRNSAYAATLRRLIAESIGAGTGSSSRWGRIEAARQAWKSGFVAREIDAFVRATPHLHSTGTTHFGVLTAEDIAALNATYETPLAITFRSITVHKAGPWSQGPVLLQSLAILEGFDDHELDLTTAGGVHRVVEALKLAMADRDAFYADGLENKVLERLLSTSYAAERRALIGAEASAALRPGRIDGEPYRPPLMLTDDSHGQSPSAGEPTVSTNGTTSGDTCHLDIIDQWGNAISATPSGGWLQSSPAIPSLGFCLGSRLQMSWLDSASPSALVPRMRPRTTLSPTMLSRDGEVISVVGTPGGDQQDQWQLLYLLRTIVGGMTPQQAIEAPACHTSGFPASFWPRTWTPAGLVVEGRWTTEIVRDLTSRGHRITTTGDWTLGRLSSVSRDPETGMLSAAANPRGAQGYAVGR